VATVAPPPSWSPRPGPGENTERRNGGHAGRDPPALVVKPGSCLGQPLPPRVKERCTMAVPHNSRCTMVARIPRLFMQACAHAQQPCLCVLSKYLELSPSDCRYQVLEGLVLRKLGPAQTQCQHRACVSAGQDAPSGGTHMERVHVGFRAWWVADGARCMCLRARYSTASTRRCMRRAGVAAAALYNLDAPASE
jgi:hypothetical protein